MKTPDLLKIGGQQQLYNNLLISRFFFAYEFKVTDIFSIYRNIHTLVGYPVLDAEYNLVVINNLYISGVDKISTEICTIRLDEVPKTD